MSPCKLFILFSTFFSLSTAYYDFCSTEPRVPIHLAHCPSSNTTSLIQEAIYIPTIDTNPYHALHDILWALSHFLTHCSQAGPQTYIYFPHKPIDFSICQSPDVALSTAYGRVWMPCVVFILARSVGIPSSNLKVYPTNSTWPHMYPPSHCVRKSVLFGVNPTDIGRSGYGTLPPHFRQLSWFGAYCSRISDTGQCINSNTTKMTSAVVALPDVQKSAALNHIRMSALSFFNLQEQQSYSDPLIHVLMYDRGDVRSRRWNNALKFVQLLTKNEQLSVRFMASTPRTFGDQVHLYAWADIVIAPHGAAMASTVFMRAGADVLEIYTMCKADMWQHRYAPQPWTGWHAHLMDLNLQYVQCHAGSVPRRRWRLSNSSNALFSVTAKAHMVRDEDLLLLLDDALSRQSERVAAGRRFSELYEASFERRPVDLDKMAGNTRNWQVNISDLEFNLARRRSESVDIGLYVADEYMVAIGAACVIVCTILVLRLLRWKKGRKT